MMKGRIEAIERRRIYRASLPEIYYVLAAEDTTPLLNTSEIKEVAKQTFQYIKEHPLGVLKFAGQEFDLGKNDFTKYWNTCVKSKKRFIFALLFLRMPGIGAHANCLIYDTKTKELERFEPHGYVNVNLYNKDTLKEMIESKLKPIIKYEKYFEPLDFCPFTNFQRMPAIHKTGVDPGGFCHWWTTYYMELRLSQPNIDRKSVVYNAFNNIRKQFPSSQSTVRYVPGPPTYDFNESIRSYAIFLNIVMKFILAVLNDKISKKEEINDVINGAMDYILNVIT